MTHELRNNGDLIISDAHGRPKAKLQTGEPFLNVVTGPHVLDVEIATLTREDLEAIRDWCDRELGADRFTVYVREHNDEWALVELHGLGELSDELTVVARPNPTTPTGTDAPTEEATPCP